MFVLRRFRVFPETYKREDKELNYDDKIIKYGFRLIEKEVRQMPN